MTDADAPRHEADEAPAAAEPEPQREGPAAEQTRDDTDEGWGERPRPLDEHDRWLLEQRPPHWD
ncbi:hypothetical protein [Angustibacter aerolatus]